LEGDEVIADAPTSRSGVVPTRNPIFGGKRRYVRTFELVSNGLNGVYTNRVAKFTVTIPSDRLHAIAYLTFSPLDSQDTPFPTDITDPGAWLLTLDAWTRLEDGRPARANNIVGTRVDPLPIPNSWESVTGVAEWHGAVTVPDPGDPQDGTGTVPGFLYLTVYWEPAAGEGNMPQEELEALFSSCSASAEPIQTYQSTGL
jgi:hypothetical protein